MILCLFTPTNMIAACDCDKLSNDKIYIIRLHSQTTPFLNCNTEGVRSRARVLHRHHRESAFPLLSHAFEAIKKFKKSASPTVWCDETFVHVSDAASLLFWREACFKYLHRRPLFLVLWKYRDWLRSVLQVWWNLYRVIHSYCNNFSLNFSAAFPQLGASGLANSF